MLRVKLVGSLVSYAKTNEIILDISQPITVMELIGKMRNNSGGQEIAKVIMDPELNDPRPNVIILINEKEIGTLDGLDTKICENDTVTFVPVTHGG